MLLIFRCYM